MMMMNKILNIKSIKYSKYIMDLNLKDVYENIADDFDTTRRIVWSCVKCFLDEIKPKSKGLEIGCGNGKNLLYRKDLEMYGIDFCERFVKICERKGLNVNQQDMRDLKFDDEIFDFTLSVAALHHLFKREDRLKSLREQVRVTKKGGKIFVLVWALEQEKNGRRIFKKQDEMVSWKKRASDIIFYRYYHLYKKNEILYELEEIKDIKLLSSFYEKGNWGIICEKI